MTHDKPVKFDTTVNIPTLIAIITLAASGFTAWSSLKERVVVLEEFTKAQTMRDISDQIQAKDRQTELRAAVDKVDANVLRLSDRFDLYRAPNRSSK